MFNFVKVLLILNVFFSIKNYFKQLFYHILFSNSILHSNVILFICRWVIYRAFHVGNLINKSFTLARKFFKSKNYERSHQVSLF